MEKEVKAPAPNKTEALTNIYAPVNAFQVIVPDYALLFFDHLYSEYLTLKPNIKDVGLRTLLDSLHAKRLKAELTWSDIYTFDLALVDASPLENLIRKALDARSKYRGIALQNEYNEYLASKPPNLTAILIQPNNETQTPENTTAPITSPATNAPRAANAQSESDEISRSAEIVTRVLRADIRYLLSKFYLYYAMLPMQEQLRQQLARRIIQMTIFMMGMILVVMALAIAGSFFFFRQTSTLEVFGVTIGSVALAGIAGGCVSTLQRIQNAPVKGDALFDLVVLTNNWRSIALSPLYGAVFASLLFVLFAAGILQGPAFPKIETSSSNVETARPEAVPAPGNNLAPSADGNVTPGPTPVITQTQRTGVLKMKDFLAQTGPRDGVSFALLVIWSFMAGFAERLVPDILNRFIANAEASQSVSK